MRYAILVMLIAFIAYLFFVKMGKWKWPTEGISFRKKSAALKP